LISTFFKFYVDKSLTFSQHKVVSIVHVLGRRRDQINIRYDKLLELTSRPCI
jgi:hypothetical protein